MGSPFTTEKYRDRPSSGGRGFLAGRGLQVTGVAAMVAVVAVVLVVTLTRGGGNPAPSDGSTAAPTATVDPSAGQASSSGAAEYATAPPVSVTFSDVGGLQLPFSPVDGPTRVSGPIAAGYSHTPQGAALAAVQIGSRLVYGPGYAQIIAAQSMATAPEQAQFTAARDGRAQLTPDDLRSLIHAAAGFQITSYTPDRAVVRVAYPHPSTNDYRAAPVLVQWTDGDWKFGDNSDSTGDTLTTLDGFTPWSQ